MLWYCDECFSPAYIHAPNLLQNVITSSFYRVLKMEPLKIAIFAPRKYSWDSSQNLINSSCHQVLPT